MMNPASLFQMKALWDKFVSNHPKFPKFLQAAAASSIDEGTNIEVKITKANGDTIASNLKVTADDLQLFQEIRNIAGQ